MSGGGEGERGLLNTKSGVHSSSDLCSTLANSSNRDSQNALRISPGCVSCHEAPLYVCSFIVSRRIKHSSGTQIGSCIWPNRWVFFLAEKEGLINPVCTLRVGRRERESRGERWVILNTSHPVITSAKEVTFSLRVLDEPSAGLHKNYEAYF